jgi:hypothetical protein
LLLFCVGSITLCIMIWRTIKLCCVRSRFPVCFRETSNLLCAVARASEKKLRREPSKSGSVRVSISFYDLNFDFSRRVKGRPGDSFFSLFIQRHFLARTRRALQAGERQRVLLGVTCNYRRALKLAPSRSHSPRYAHLCAPRAPQGPSRLFCSLFSRWPPPYLRYGHINHSCS